MTWTEVRPGAAGKKADCCGMFAVGAETLDEIECWPTSERPGLYALKLSDGCIGSELLFVLLFVVVSKII
jgi:hypothetical protein